MPTQDKKIDSFFWSSHGATLSPQPSKLEEMVSIHFRKWVQSSLKSLKSHHWPQKALHRKTSTSEKASRFATLESRVGAENWSIRRLALAASAHPNCTRYLEIGIFKGETLANVPVEFRVGVDPKPRFDLANLPEGVTVIPETSDRYFRSLRSGQNFDLIFLDGLHYAEQTFRDLWNSLHHSRETTLILVDDVFPDSDITAIPNEQESLAMQIGSPRKRWHGDVWKTILAINSAFPGMTVSIIYDVHRESVDRDNPQALIAVNSSSLRPSRRVLRSGLKVIKDLQDAVFSETVMQYPDLFRLYGEEEIERLVRRAP